MRIIIVGAGEVGFQLAKKLSQEDHDVIVIEGDEVRQSWAAEQLDVMTLKGSGTSLTTLEQAGINGADMMIAVTDRDEVNLMACMIAGQYDVGKKIARVGDQDYYRGDAILTREKLSIDLMINPDLECAKETFNLLSRMAATDVAEFAEGAVVLLGLKIASSAPVAGMTLAETAKLIPNRDFLAVAISRNGKTIVPGGRDRIFKDDHVFVIGRSRAIPEMMRLAGYGDLMLERSMIVGGGDVGFLLAQMLEEGGIQSVLIEEDKKRCVKLAEGLNGSLVLCGDGTNLDLLQAEGVSEMDGFVAATEDDGTNILSALLAKHFGAKKVIALLKRMEYIPLASTIGIDAAVNPRFSTLNAILRFVRGENVVAIATIKGYGAEAIEFVVNSGSSLAGKKLVEIKFPRGAILGTIIRGKHVIVPYGQSEIEVDDKVIVFALPGTIEAVESMFKK